MKDIEEIYIHDTDEYKNCRTCLYSDICGYDNDCWNINDEQCQKCTQKRINAGLCPLKSIEDHDKKIIDAAKKEVAIEFMNKVAVNYKNERINYAAMDGDKVITMSEYEKIIREKAEGDIVNLLIKYNLVDVLYLKITDGAGITDDDYQLFSRLFPEQLEKYEVRE